MGRGCATSLLSCIVWCVCVVWHAYALRVGVIHYRPSSMPIKAFEVGFVSAMSVLEKDGDIEVEWINCDSFNGKRPEDLNLDRRFDHLDILMVKSNWDWSVDSFVRAHLRNVRVPKMLLISGVTPPPKGGDLHFYDVLVHETRWYWPQIAGHPRTARAFGIDTDIMRPAPNGSQPAGGGTVSESHAAAGTAYDYDYMFVGAFVNYKRPLKLLQKRGRRLAIGKQDADAGPEAPGIAQALREGGVEVRQLVDHMELARLMRRSRTVYLPATTVGGGERAVLEARAVGAHVEIENDNPKLAELLHGTVPSHRDYARQLRTAIAMTPLRAQVAACSGLTAVSRPRVVLKRQPGGTATPRVRTLSTAGELHLAGEGLACVRRTKAELLLLHSNQNATAGGHGGRRGQHGLALVTKDAFVTLHNNSALTVFVPSLGAQPNHSSHPACAPEAQLASLRLRLTANRGANDTMQALSVQPVLVVPPSQMRHPSVHATRLLIDLSTVHSGLGLALDVREHGDQWLFLRHPPPMAVCIPHITRTEGRALTVTATEPLSAMHLRAWGVSTMLEVVILAHDSHEDGPRLAVGSPEAKFEVENDLDAHARLVLGAWRLLRAGGILRLCLCGSSFNDPASVAPTTTPAGQQLMRAIADARSGGAPAQKVESVIGSWPLPHGTLERDGHAGVYVAPSGGCSAELVTWRKPLGPPPQTVGGSVLHSGMRPLPWTLPALHAKHAHSSPDFPLDVLVLHATNASAQAARALRALREAARYAAMWRLAYWPIDTDAIEARCIIGGHAPQLPTTQLRAANSSHLVLGLGAFRGAVDYVLSYMHLSRGVLGLRPVPKGLWLEGSAKPWGEGVYALLLATTAEQRAITAAMDGGAGHHNVAVLPSGAIAAASSATEIGAGANTDALDSLRASATVRALLTVSPAQPMPTQLESPGHGTPSPRSSVPPPRRYNWAIGTLQGPSVFELSEMGEASALTRTAPGPDIHAGDVTDRSAVFVADPFIISAPEMHSDATARRQKRLFVFFEVLPADMRGVIAVARLNGTDTGLDSGTAHWVYDRVVLDEPDAHLSFPYVFEHDGSWYMTVEAHQMKCVPLYRTDASRFPAGWQKLGCLLAGETYQDNALLHHNGWWWLWTTVEMAPHDWRQRLYYSRDLGGPYVPHPSSPLNGSNGAMKIGCARGRLGGRLLRARHWSKRMGASASASTGAAARPREALLRFTQVAAPWYGTRLDAWLITRLDEDSYEEEWAGPVLLGSRSPLVHPELRGDCGAGGDDGRMGSSCNADSGSNQPWQANMMHQLDAVPLDADGSRYLAVVDGASDGGGLRCQLHGDVAWHEAEKRCAAPLEAALDAALLLDRPLHAVTAGTAASALRDGVSYSLPLRFELDLSRNASDVVVAAMIFGEPARAGDLPPSAFSFSRSAHMLRAAAGNGVLQVQLSAPGPYELVVAASACDGVVVRRRSIRFVLEDHNSGSDGTQAQNFGAHARRGQATVLQPIRPLLTFPWRCACNGLPAESACTCTK